MKKTQSISRSTWKSIKAQVADIRQLKDSASLKERQRFFSTCKEFKNEILTADGKLKYSAQEVFAFIDAEHISRWTEELIFEGMQYLRDKEYQRALDNAALVISLSQKNHKAHFLKAVALFRSGRLQAARYAFQDTIDLNPSYLSAYAERARLFFQLHAYEKAAADAQFILLADKEHIGANALLAELYNKTGGANRTVQLLSKLSVTQHSSELLHLLSSAYRKTGRLTKAYSCYKRLVQLNAFDAEALFQMSQIHEKLQIEKKKGQRFLEQSMLLGHRDATLRLSA